MTLIYMLTGVAAYVSARVGWSIAGVLHRYAAQRSARRRDEERAAATDRLGVPRRGGTRSADR